MKFIISKQRNCCKKIGKNLLDNYIKILKVMLPIVPHIATECLTSISSNKVFLWPEINKEFLEIKNIILLYK